MFSTIASFKRNRLKVLRAVSKGPKTLTTVKYPELQWAINHHYVSQLGDWNSGEFKPNGTFEITEDGKTQAVILANETWSNRRSWAALIISVIAIFISLLHQ